MKLLILTTPLFMGLLLAPSVLVAQDTRSEFQLKNGLLTDMVPSGDGGFFLISEKISPADLVVQNLAKSKNILKFDGDLNLVWQEALAIKGIAGSIVNPMTYVDPQDKTAVHYLFGSEQFIQISADGTVKEKDTGISSKETRNTGAAFVNAQGLNMITITGDETFPTGAMNWYTFSHEDLSAKKRSIALPLPPDIDKDNDSGWRLNEVADSGLYFYYVSYKNIVKDETRPILSCHVVYVDPEGKAGKMVSIDLGLKSYSVMPVDFQQSLYPNLQVFSPPLYETGINGGGSQYHIPNDNAYLGVKIDANAGRIYTAEARNKDIEVNKNGLVKSDVAGRDLPVADLYFSIFDLEGKQIGKVVLDYNPVKLGLTDNPSKLANEIEIFPLREKEGAVCRMLTNGTGHMWAIDDNGGVVRQMKFKPYSFKILSTKLYNDLFWSRYSSMKEFENTPYHGGEASKVAGFFENLEQKQKEGAFYISLETSEVIAVWDQKENKVQFFSFNKN